MDHALTKSLQLVQSLGRSSSRMRIGVAAEGMVLGWEGFSGDYHF